MSSLSQRPLTWPVAFDRQDQQYDRQIQQVGQTEYLETQALLKVYGVGHIPALTYMLTLQQRTL